jgi:AcrR family transcriptional regulator
MLMPRAPSLNPRKTATQTRAAHTVSFIVEAAARILEERGMEGYTTNAIAEKAGVSIGSLYQYFPNKDSITIALIARESTRLVTSVTEAARLADWREALTQMVKAAVEHQMRRPNLARLLDNEEGRLPDRSRENNDAAEIHSALQTLLIQAKLPIGEEPGIVAGDLMAMTQGMTDMAGARGEADAGALLRRVLRAVFGYLEAETPD